MSSYEQDQFVGYEALTRGVGPDSRPYATTSGMALPPLLPVVRKHGRRVRVEGFMLPQLSGVVLRPLNVSTSCWARRASDEANLVGSPKVAMKMSSSPELAEVHVIVREMEIPDLVRHQHVSVLCLEMLEAPDWIWECSGWVQSASVERPALVESWESRLRLKGT
jgi:hypothetical protein